ncbi:hypothetical protein B0H63DRAFT_520594 [Podospora didyma]|uniref:Uncharacterized protein n=1 Tax=Podospora didyma TaxID=330526 RepID=A0AAE0NRS9_9PEZI|nr:hypothetical protein B0H63DRAFT_520594 [Podospora didyma]
MELKFTEIVLSLMSQDRFNPFVNVSLPCMVESRVQRWQYRPFWLAVPYGIAAGVALVAVVAGAHAFWIMGYSLGKAPLRKHVLRNKLPFGDITGTTMTSGRGCGDDTGTSTGVARRAGFGSEANVYPVAFGERYH